MQRTPAVLLALALAAPLSAQALEVETYRLDNGLNVILHEDHSTPRACVNLWYYVGSKDEREGRSGFAHLFEHLMFMGTERVPGAQFDLIMEGGGGYNNATTSPDRTNYFEAGPSELLPTLLWLEADRLEALDEAMTAEKLDLQREVVLNERRQSYENAPYGEVQLVTAAMMYPPGHPYHDTTIGSPEDLRAATVEDVQDFFTTYYVPNNASLCVAGDFDPAQIRPLIDELFGSLPPGPAVVHSTAEPVRLERSLRRTLTDDVRLARLTLTYHSPALYTPGDAELDLLGAVLSDGVSSRLYQRLVVEEPLAVEVGASQVSGMLGSLFQVDVLLRPGATPEAAEAAVDEVLAAVVDDGIEEDELARQQVGYEYRAVRDLEDLLRRADRLNAYAFHFGEPLSFERDLDRYRDATVDSVREAARRVFAGERLALLVLPEEEAPAANPRDERPGPGEASSFAVPTPAVFELSNGIEVRHWQRDDLPLLEVLLQLSSGAAWDGPERAGLAALVGEMLDEGSGGLDAAGFQDALSRLGARFRAAVDHQDTRITLSTLARNAEPALGLMADAVRAPAFDEAEWERVADLAFQGLVADADDPRRVGPRAAMRVYFGDDHPYGWPVEGTPATVRALTRKQAIGFHASHYRPSRATLFSAGAVSAEEARRLLEGAFGDWQEREGDEPPALALPRPPARDGFRVALVEREGAVQTTVRFLLPAPPYGAPHEVAREALGTLLGGSFTSRLNANLRERNGYTYGARSSFSAEPAVGWFSAGAAVRADATGPALREFAVEFERLRGGELDADDVSKAAAVRRTRTIDRFASLGGLLGAAADLELRGEDLSRVGRELRELEALTVDQLVDVAAGNFGLDGGILLLVGDGDLVRGQLAELGWPAPEVVSSEGDAIPMRLR